MIGAASLLLGATQAAAITSNPEDESCHANRVVTISLWYGELEAFNKLVGVASCASYVLTELLNQ